MPRKAKKSKAVAAREQKERMRERRQADVASKGLAAQIEVKPLARAMASPSVGASEKNCPAYMGMAPKDEEKPLARAMASPSAGASEKNCPAYTGMAPKDEEKPLARAMASPSAGASEKNCPAYTGMAPKDEEKPLARRLASPSAGASEKKPPTPTDTDITDAKTDTDITDAKTDTDIKTDLKTNLKADIEKNIDTEKFVPSKRRKMKPVESQSDVYSEPMLYQKIEPECSVQVRDDSDILIINDSSHLCIQGSFHQGLVTFGHNAGKQCVANCLIALAYSRLNEVKSWTRLTLDNILREGHELYTFIHGNHELLLVSDLPSQIEVLNRLVRFEQKESFASLINTDNSVDFSNLPGVLPLDQSIQESLIDSDGCFICVKGNTSVVIKQRGKLYLFDSHARNTLGLPDSNGASLVMELTDVEHLYQHLCNFVGHNVSVQYEVTGVSLRVPLLENEVCLEEEIAVNENTSERTEPTNESLQRDDDRCEEQDVILQPDSCVTERFDYKPLDVVTKRKLCTLLNIPSKQVSKAGTSTAVQNMGSPTKTHNIIQDGNCLFRALSYAISQRQQYHQHIRKSVVEHCLENTNTFNSFTDTSVHEHASTMSENGTWGTSLEILAAAHLLETDIYTFLNGKWFRYSSKQIDSENVVNNKAIYLKNLNHHYEVVLNVETGDDTKKHIKLRKREIKEKSLNKLDSESDIDSDLNSDSIQRQCTGNKRRTLSKSLKEKEMYNSVPEFKARKKARYEENKEQIIIEGKTKYIENEIYREELKKTSKRKYAADENLREVKKDNSKRKYDEDQDFRQNVRGASKTKYATNKEFQKHVIETSRKKYATNEEFRESVIDASKLKYASSLDHQLKIVKQTTLRRKKVKEESSKIDFVLNKFKQEVKSGPEFVCGCCFRLFFESQVHICKMKNFEGKGECIQNIASVCISDKYVHKCNKSCTNICNMKQTSRKDLWVCRTCNRKILNGQMPAESYANNLELDDVPQELESLNILEQHLVSLNIPFMKIVGLPKGGQKGVHGPVVCVPSNLTKTINALPRLEDEDQLLKVKLKRKLCYKGYEDYRFVNTKHLETALRYLKGKNKWYSDVELNDKFLSPIPEETTDHDGIEKTDITVPENQSALNPEKEENDCEEMNNSYIDDSLQGVQLDTCLQPADIGQEILDTRFDQEFCLSPAEGNQPVSVLRENGLEAKAFPAHYPTGKNTLNEDREDKLSLLRYFNLRLMSVESRFARDTSYIFFCQYLAELDRVLSNVQIALRKESPFSIDGKKVTGSMISDKESLTSMFKNQEAIKYLKPVRGTPPYWQATQKDLFAMIRQLGTPDFFCSFSSADFRWPEVCETIMKQQGDTRNVDNLDWDEKCKILRSNPVTVARMFEHRFHAFLHGFILSDANPIGKVIDYFYRVEFQQRGSPHTHCLFWIEGAPKFGKDEESKIVEFVDKYITCEIPDKENDPELHEIVKSVHQHSKKHSKSCKKKGTTCRFNFPRPPSMKTFIAKPQENNDDDNTEKERAKQRIDELWKCILDSKNEGLSTADLFEKVHMSQEEFEKCSQLLAKRNTVILKRRADETYINHYNEHLLRAWDANIDIQYVLDAYSCVVYIISYITKAERELGLLLQQTKIEAREGNMNAQATMKKVGTAYMHHREISAQEAVFRVTGLKLKECSRKVEFIPVGDNPCKMSLPLKELQKKRDDEEIWMTSVVDRYKERPRTEDFENMSLAQFVADFNVLAKSQVPKKINQETTFQLGNNLGYIRKRTRTQRAVIKYPRFEEQVCPEKYYQSILQLFLPYRIEKQLKPPQVKTYEEFYKNGNIKPGKNTDIVRVKSVVDKNRADFVEGDQSIDIAVQDLEENGYREDAWAQLCPESEVVRQECIEEGVASTAEETEMSRESVPDLNQEQQTNQTNLTGHIFKRNDVVPLLRSLNEKQRRIFYKVREWCVRTANGEQQKPFHVFITGGAGTGKSHLIKCIYYEATRLLAKTLDNPDDLTVLLTAPTGTAAFNIHGSTIHSAFGIFKSLSADHATLSEEKINSLRSKLESLKILIIDEVSMVNKRMLFFIHRRLCQVKKTLESCLFGGVSIIAVGDFYQLPPVKTSKSDKLYIDDPSSAVNHLWWDLFQIVELDEIMRQRDDSPFAEMLNRLRIKKKEEDINHEDLKAIAKCMLKSEPDDVLHIYPTNNEVKGFNNKMILKLGSETKLLEAEDFDKQKASGKLTKRRANFTNVESLLPSSLLLAEGARVMLTKNIDTQDGLVNGVMGTVMEIGPMFQGSLPNIVFIKFDNKRVGQNARTQKKIDRELCIGIEPITEDIPLKSGKRKQYPLQLAWACTVHKVQGLTVNECVIDLNKCFSYGQAYVALSRVTSLEGMYLQFIDQDKLVSKVYCDPDVAQCISSMKTFLRDQTENANKSGMTIMYHNIQGLQCHIEDLKSNPDFKNCDCICLTETWLDNTKEMELCGYHLVNLPRSQAFDGSTDLFQYLKTLQNGGVGVYIKDGCRIKAVPLPVNNLECVVVELECSNTLVVNIYRTQKFSMNTFMKQVAILLERLSHVSDILVVGDFNQDLLKRESTFEDFMRTKGFRQIVKSATTESGTLIDHVYVKGLDNITVSVKPTYYSYHEALKVQLS